MFNNDDEAVMMNIDDDELENFILRIPGIASIYIDPNDYTLSDRFRSDMYKIFKYIKAIRRKENHYEEIV